MNLLIITLLKNGNCFKLIRNRYPPLNFLKLFAQPIFPAHYIFFCDASNTAVGAAAYSATTTSSHLITSRTRAAPLKTRSLPQLELTAIWIAVNLPNIFIPYNQTCLVQPLFWSDSEVALQWVCNNKCDDIYNLC